MINNNNTTMSQSSAPSSTATNAQSPGLKTYFKTPEGRYKLQYEKTHPTSFVHFPLGKTITQVTLAPLKDKPAQAPPSTSSSMSVSSGVRSAAARFLGGGNGSRTLSFVGGNGGSKSVSVSSRVGSIGASSSTSLMGISNFDGKGTYLVFNVGDAIFISDSNSQDKDPIKCISFNNAIPVCHAFDPDAKDGHDLLIAFVTGDVYLVSLRQQLQDVGKKLVGAQHYNKDGCVNNSRCTSIAWVPNGDGAFIVAHSDGNFYVYEKNKDGSTDPLFPVIKDQTQFSVAHARYSKNPIARWHICQGSINSIAFSTDGTYIATVGRDGYLRVFDYKNEQLICGGKSYYGALLCCSWSVDGKYVLTGGEDDLVQVWSIEDRKVVAWGEGHNSWVSGVAFDSYWSPPNSDGSGENVIYRFVSAGQDTQLLFWDLELDEIIVPLRRAPGGSPTFSAGNQSSHWDTACPVGTLQPAPSMRDVPKLSPVVAHRVHIEPLSGLILTQESIITGCRDGLIRIWSRPGFSESQSNGSDSLLNTTLKEKPLTGKVGTHTYKQ
ncbi:WD repeat-containing protein [Actinidia chinensis var. chinensis]|uniref:WD repeat-containing protein n=1 Tax=Actinidia chinensis var. chinensis TaxID=1590841 RepID=A0A2R6PKH7_ACTCC|nr:WD repeat-containing protein [Actinidia chinensis var. chinensis]